MYDDLTGRTGVLFLQMLDQAALAECMETLGNSSGVYQVSTAYLAGNVTV